MVLVVLVSLASLVVAAIVSVNLESPQKRKALADAQSLALQLASGGLGTFQQPKAVGSRLPASIFEGSNYKHSLKIFGKQGRIGRDPWGNAFHYDFLEDEAKSKVFISVWSDGPNGAKDTAADSIHVHEEEGRAFVILQGDDLGFVREVPRLE